MMDKRKTRLICLMICENGFYTEKNRFGNKIKVNRSAYNGEALFFTQNQIQSVN